MLNANKIIIRPIVTERSEKLKNENNQYTFQVALQANKNQVSKAVEQLFRVKVKQVRIMNYDGKPKRMGAFMGTRSNWKKAIVTLQKGEKIESLER
ncbi:MAG: 50S ribosomal protein L23 [candidate division WOR-3 bacterium]